MSPPTPQPAAMPIQAPRLRAWLGESAADADAVDWKVCDVWVDDESGESVGLCVRVKLEESRADEDCEVKLLVLLSEGAAELTKDEPAVESGDAVWEVLSAEPVIEDDTAVSEVAMPAGMATGDD